MLCGVCDLYLLCLLLLFMLWRLADLLCFGFGGLWFAAYLWVYLAVLIAYFGMCLVVEFRVWFVCWVLCVGVC